MTNYRTKNGAGDDDYLKATGTGTDGDPHVIEQAVTVAGVATAANQTTMIGHVDGIEALLGTMDADTSTLAGAVADGQVQADIVAALPAGANTIGKIIIVDGGGLDLEFAKEGDNWAAGDHGIILFARDTDTNPDTYRAVQVDANGHLKATLDALPAGTNNIGDVDVATITVPTAIYHGQTAVTTAGTEVALASSQAILSGVTIKALHANTGMIYVGANPVTSTTGFVLDAGEQIFLEVANLATVYIDSSVNGEGVSWVAS